MKYMALIAVAAMLVGCGGTKKQCSGGDACLGTDGDCMSCASPSTCNSGGTCSNTINGVACCTGGGGGGGGGGCGCGTECNSNGICCPRGDFGCNGVCYSTYDEALSAGCTGVTTCCP